MIYEFVMLDVIFFEQEIVTNYKVESVDHYITLSSTVVESIKPLQISQQLSLVQLIEVSVDRSLSVAHTLTLTQEQHPRVYWEDVSHILIIAQDIVRDANSIHHVLELEQEIDVMVSSHVGHELEFTQEISVSMTRNFTVAHTIPLQSAANGYLPDPCFINGNFTVEAP